MCVSEWKLLHAFEGARSSTQAYTLSLSLSYTHIHTHTCATPNPNTLYTENIYGCARRVHHCVKLRLARRRRQWRRHQTVMRIADDCIFRRFDSPRTWHNMHLVSILSLVYPSIVHILDINNIWYSICICIFLIKSAWICILLIYLYLKQNKIKLKKTHKRIYHIYLIAQIGKIFCIKTN